MNKQELALREEHAQLKKLLEAPDVYGRKDYPTLARREGELSRLISLFDKKDSLSKDLESTHSLSTGSDQELAKLASEEAEITQDKLDKVAAEIAEALLPKDGNDIRDCVVEIRAAAGGDEASLFAGDLYRMYARWGEAHGYKTELAGDNPSEVGGFKEVIFMVRGDGAYGSLKFEAGVHRVQRIPSTESSGRIHTSTVTVAVLPEAEETDVQINPDELRIDVFRSSGHGGQSVNTTDSAVRITHLPTGIVVSMQDEKSQIKK